MFFTNNMSRSCFSNIFLKKCAASCKIASEIPEIFMKNHPTWKSHFNVGCDPHEIVESFIRSIENFNLLFAENKHE